MIVKVRSRIISCCGIILLALGFWRPALASAQSEASALEATDATRRADCRLATQALTTGRPEPLYDWASSFLPFCEISAGSTLAALWQRSTTDSLVLSELYFMSSAIRDQRILDAVVAVAETPSAGWWRRATALRVLASYVMPGVALRPDDIRIRSDSAVRYLVAGHMEQREGSVRFDANWSARVRDVFVNLASTDSDPAVRHTARFIFGILEPAFPD